MAEHADLIRIELRALLIGGDIPNMRFGMGAHHGGKVIDQFALVETPYEPAAIAAEKESAATEAP